MSLLPDAAAFRRLVDGSARGVGPAAARACLAALAAPYAAAVAARNAAYDAGLLAARPAPVPVVSIGNLTLGGTGKTPLVAWAARVLEAADLRPAIVSRGYGARRGERSDEAAELAVVLPRVSHVANPDRFAAATAAARAGARSIVLDDGFQHRRLGRDIDIIAVDATDPYGCGRLFPRGLLREPLSGLARADAVVLTRAQLVDERRRAEIRATLSRACDGAMPPVWAEAIHRPVALRTATGASLPLDRLRSARIAAFAGIGNPAAFAESLRRLGSAPIAFRAFPDHHAYSDDELRGLAGWARERGADLVATTLKDLVKVRRDDLDGLPLVAVEIAIDILRGGDELEDLVRSVARGPAAATSASPRGACASAGGGNTS